MTSDSSKKPRDVENDPRSELGLRSPVRDKAKLGDAQYGVTPPRDAVKNPRDAGSPVTCAACSAELDSAHAYRADGEEYAYHFCDATCHDRWRARRRAQRAEDDPRLPKP